MQCANVKECLEQIKDYLKRPNQNQFLFVNVQNSSDYQEILDWSKLNEKRLIFVSEFCRADDFPSDVFAIDEAMKKDFSFLVGLSQALMLRGEKMLEEKLDELRSLTTPVQCSVILLLGCENYLKKFFPRDPRLPRRVILVTGKLSPQPKIYLSTDDFHQPNTKLVHGIKELLQHLERGGAGEIYLVSAKLQEDFGESCYQIKRVPNAYEWLEDNFYDLRNAAPESFGTDDEWKYLASFRSSCSNFTEVVCQNFGSKVNLSTLLGNVMRARDENKKWLLWLALKVFGDESNKYLSRVLQSSKTASDFPERVYLELANVDANDKEFSRLYDERKILIESFGKGSILPKDYCKKLNIRQKNEIFYLTDKSDIEEREFVSCLAKFDYSDAEIARAVGQMSEKLASYMVDYDFNSAKGVPNNSPDITADELTAYFKEYKLQKLTNKIHPEFLKKVEKYAESRPYNSFKAYSKLTPKNLAKDKCKPFFIDALGVEYLGFILDYCKKNGMEAEITIGRCKLPSTTEVNKEIVEKSCSSWGEDIPKFNALDDIKHKGEEFDFRKCPYPIHLFKELSVIEEILVKIHSELSQRFIDKALIVSDHGASRLAVLYGKECAATLKLDESGEKSGRCCRTKEKPDLPVSTAVYESGYVVMANYERIRGGRRADVEVHGGASLEEVLVPVIVLSMKPERQEISFAKSSFELGRRDVLTLDLTFAVTLERPRLFIDDKYYDCEKSDNNYAKFTIPEIKKGTHVAQVFDGDKNLGCKLEFTVKSKMVKENKLL